MARTDVTQLTLSTDDTAMLSPANTQGSMGGGFDAAVARVLGWPAGRPDTPEPNPLQASMQLAGKPELPVGQAMAVEISHTGMSPQQAGRWKGLRWLIAAPTMPLPPGPIHDPGVVTAAMRAGVECARGVSAQCIVSPAFGTGWGGLDGPIAAEAMVTGFHEAWT